ncbi:LON peptidase substrate-binding domain-containing protein [Tepidiforma sp.]|uniref:LON peptidase substrate-binding domain-containing protein n=1 Tax=Tepidiforma sp. TaxID=2682230 RepID=UPI0026266386|nr:LON peptidase substrate-binding domain-containing protein [Tepidiforma sp.]MCX7618137.1 LON peptidase substrate-binding domain-containing protein [Tepidiforma sp.]
MELPLFPLRTVLFPGMRLPLRIFEERYRVMIRELLENGGEFGVVLIREGPEVGPGAIPYDVGTAARLESCEETDGGRYLITARGTWRFRIDRLLPPRPYPYGEVTPLDDADGPTTPRLKAALETVRATFPLYFRLVLSLTDQWARGLDLPQRPHRLVDFLGEWLQVGEDVKQRLLEIEPAEDRVAYLAEVLDDLILRTKDAVIEHRRKKYGALGIAN